MDVYITCLVAMDKLKQGSADKEGDSDGASSDGVFSEDIEREIQLPVLLNLALCALKLGTLRKAESFCNFALQTSLGADCPKAYFRRGRARMLMGSYDDARSDLQRAVDLLQNVNADDGVDKCANDNTAREAELKAVRKELQKLERLEFAARKHEKVQKKNMKRLWDTAKSSNAVEANGTTPDQSISSSAVDAVISESSSVKAEKSEGQSNARSTVESKKGLYSDVQERRQFSTLRAKKRIEASVEEEDDDVDVVSPSFFQWYLSLLERCLRKALHILGDEEGASMEFPTPEDKDK
jgi:tetratricopeptide (TPR) repeat protein